MTEPPSKSSELSHFQSIFFEGSRGGVWGQGLRHPEFHFSTLPHFRKVCFPPVKGDLLIEALTLISRLLVEALTWISRLLIEALTWISRLLIEALTSPHEHMHCKSVPGLSRYTLNRTGDFPAHFKSYRESPGTLSPLSVEHKDANEL